MKEKILLLLQVGEKTTGRGIINCIRKMDKLKEKFQKTFGEEVEDIYSAAGRVNLIGEHIDYCGGRVLPAALSLNCRVAARKNGTNFMRIAATTIDARAEIDLTNTDVYRNLAWGSYQAGVAHD